MTDSRNSIPNAHVRRKRRRIRPLLPATAYPPPMKSKYRLARQTEYQILLQRHLDRNEKARVRMARKRAALKAGPVESQRIAAERERGYQSHYRAGHRELLRDLDLARRMSEHRKYEELYGHEALIAYAEGRKERRRNAIARRRAKEPYHSDHDMEDSSAEEDGILSDDFLDADNEDDGDDGDDDDDDSLDADDDSLMQGDARR
ncbi:hypothetical protein R3P38DRAFT_3198681 [Favolaschia claudopus]|uniref:Uncharacterized protein n=1 Tax=Favolaschia claudopus TaxID=2862362 RepID=A0AAW0B256_9AGAR